MPAYTVRIQQQTGAWAGVFATDDLGEAEDRAVEIYTTHNHDCPVSIFQGRTKLQQLFVKEEGQ